MQNTISKLLILVFFLSLTACSDSMLSRDAYLPEAPMNYQFDTKPQHQLNGSQHWSIIAKDIVKQIKTTTERYELSGRPIYFNLQSADSQFTNAFKEFLVEHSIKSGINVSNKANNSMVLNYKIQTVKFNPYRSMYHSKRFNLTRLAAGVIVARDIMDLLSAGSGADTLVAAGAFDSIIDQFAPQLEVIVSTSILNNNLYIHKTSDIYYAERLDLNLYKNIDNKSYSSVFEDPFYR